MRSQKIKKPLNKFLTIYSKNPDNERRGQPSLPVTISIITPQKKKRNRYSLFDEKDFICSVSAETLLKFNIHIGTVLTKKFYNSIVKEEEIQKVKSYLLNLLSRRDHSEGELKLKSDKKGFDRILTEQIIDEFKAAKYVDDQKFADKYAREKFRLNKWGPHKIKSELFKKKIKAAYITNTLNKLNDSLDQKQICVDLVSKKRKFFLRESDVYKRKQKIFTYLRQKGFSMQTIKSAMKELDKIVDV